MTPFLKAWLWTVTLAVCHGDCRCRPRRSRRSTSGAGFCLTGHRTPALRTRTATARTRAALYGCGMGIDGEALSSVGNFGEIPGLEVGLGYILHPALRLEGAIQYRPDFSFDGSSNFSGLELSDRRDVTAELSALSGIVAAYVDIFELLLLQFATRQSVRSSGLGGGLSLMDIGETRMNFPRTYTIVPGGNHVDLSWMADGRLGDITAGTDDGRPVAWRYTDHGAIETPSGTGRVVWRDGSREPLPLDLAGTKGRLRSHGLNYLVAVHVLRPDFQTRTARSAGPDHLRGFRPADYQNDTGDVTCPCFRVCWPSPA